MFCKLAVSMLCFSLLSAQVLPVGTVDGSILDSTSAPVPDVKVTLTNVENGRSLTNTTSVSGNYFFQLVPPGRYQVIAEKAGFKKAVQDIVVATGNRSTADFSLEIGQLTESIQVSGQAPLLQTSTSVVSRNIEQRQIQELPLLGRNPLKLMLLTAGVTANAASNSDLLDVSGTSYVSTNGSNRRQNEFLLDGIPNNISDRVNYIPPVDVVEEFTVQTNALDAEYGHGGGAYVNITSKSGTNQFHGQFYDFLRNDKLNANTFFNNRAGVKKAPFRYNQFGAAAGGPFIPNKVFWFFNWESFRQRSAGTRFYTAPTDLQRQGDFSQTTDRSNSLMAIHDPFSTRASGTAFIRDPFPGNRIPANRIDPISRNIMPRYPSPNGPGDPGAGTNNLILNLATPFDGDAYSGRLDSHVKNHRIFGRFSINSSFAGQPQPYDIGGMEGNNRVQTSIGFGDTWILSPSTVVTAHAGYSRWTQEGYHPTFDVAGLGFPAALVSRMQQTIFPLINAGPDVGPMGAVEGNWFEHTNTYSFQTGLNKSAARHNMKFGFQMQIKQNNSVGAQFPSGNYAFNRGFTQGPDPNRVATNSGNSIASFLLGTPATGVLNIRAFNATQAPYYSWYFQDDLKLTQKLTLNLGVRYELTLGTTERFDRNVFGLDRETSNPIEQQAKANYARGPIPELAPNDFRVLGGLVFVTPENRRNAVADRDNWAPRIGVAYRIRPRTVLRAGIGVFYSYWWQPFVRQDGFSAESSMVTTLDGGRTPADLFRNPFPQGLVEPVGSSLGLRTLLGQNVQSYDQFRKAIRNNRWSFGFQQELRRTTALELNYVGQRGSDLPAASNTGDDVRELNGLPQRYYSLGSRLQDSVTNPFAGLIDTGALSRPTVARRQLLLPFPHFSAVNLQRQSIGSSNYHSLQLTATQRMATGASLQFTYTWSKLMEQLRFIDPGDAAPSKMIGEFDNPHRATLAGIWEFPFGVKRRFQSNSAIVNHVLGGWQVSGTFIYQSGAAVPLAAAGLASGTSPEVSGRSIDNWFNRDAIRLLPPFTARTLPFAWSSLRQLHQNNWDISFLKNTVLWPERNVRLQLRFEMINAFNRVWFGNPDVNPASGSFGRVTGQSNQPRNIQLALKLQF